MRRGAKLVGVLGALLASRNDFRRAAVRNLVRAGVPDRVAMQLTGHKTRAVFERYKIVSVGDLRDAARRLDSDASGAACWWRIPNPYQPGRANELNELALRIPCMLI